VTGVPGSLKISYYKVANWKGRSQIKEEELVIQAQQGNEAAVELLIRHTYEDIYRFVRWKVHDPDLAWDLAQMTYERAWARLDTFDRGQGRFKAWVLAIANHICIDHLRSKAVRQASLNQSLPADLPVQEDFLDGILMREEVRQVYTAIGELPEPQREALLLRYKRELTYQEIAVVTEESESAVKARVRRSLERLRNMLCPPDRDAPSESARKGNANEG
jgi:RNA polymerase sigma-70 factor, ECF subfamily